MTKFYGIGVGPGDPELITIKGVKALEKIDVLYLPETKKGEKGVAHQIVEPYLKANLQIEKIGFPMVKDEEIFIKAGKEAARAIEQHINNGKNVAFVTLGDPSIYSTYGYILKNLSQSIAVETIPGITSFCAAAAMANQPLVERDQVLSILPMNAKDEQINQVLSHSDVFAFLKIYNRETRVLEHIRQHNMVHNSILVEKCGFNESKIHTNIQEALTNNKEYLTLLLSKKGGQ